MALDGKLTQNDAFFLNRMVKEVGAFNRSQGWQHQSDEIMKELDFVSRYDTPAHTEKLKKSFNNYLAGAMIALIHSELSEALEGLRKDLMDDHLPHRKMVEVEMADVLIRLFDFCDRFDLDLGNAVLEKDEYNHRREDHKKENRDKKGGKSF